MPKIEQWSDEQLLQRLVRWMPILSFPDDYGELKAEILRRMALASHAHVLELEQELSRWKAENAKLKSELLEEGENAT